jgi:hypothetical protein
MSLKLIVQVQWNLYQKQDKISTTSKNALFKHMNSQNWQQSKIRIKVRPSELHIERSISNFSSFG